MKQIILVLLIVVTASLSNFLYGQKVSKEDALRVGLNFYRHNAGELNVTKSNFNVKDYSLIRTSEGEDVIHVFNFDNEGFILVSAEMTAIPVLAYSYEDNFNMEDIAPATKMWIQNYVSQYEEISVKKSAPSAKLLKQWEDCYNDNFAPKKGKSKGVSSMVSTKWNQGKGYNYYCPTNPPNYPKPGDDGKCLTGCVATAMAQVMKHHEHPAKGSGEGRYYWGDYIDVKFGEEYKWDIMPRSVTGYIYNNDPDAMKAVATLMFHAGVSVNMSYGPEESGAVTELAIYSFRQNFGYRAGLEYKSRNVIPDKEWNFLLMQELELNRPIIYSGRGKDNNGNVIGHAFVCDGYQSDETINYFHFNWGWGGLNDGYYYIDVISMDSINNGIQFPMGQAGIFNLAPGGEKGRNYLYCKGGVVLPSTEGTLEDGSGPNPYFDNTSCQWLMTVEGSPQEFLEKFDSLKIVFNSFSTLEGDVLSIYDGDSEDAPLIGRYEGNSKPPAIITTSGRNLYLTFETDGSGQGEGWELTYSVVQKSELGSKSEEILSNVNIYPNPTSDYLKIEGISGKSSVKIYDIYGKQLIDVANFNSNSIDIANLSAGIYFVRIEKDSDVRTMKFIKD